MRISSPHFLLASLALMSACGEINWDANWGTKRTTYAPTPQEASSWATWDARWPTDMTIIGDSISTGLLGGTHMGGDLPTEYLAHLWNGTWRMQLGLREIAQTEKTRYSPFTGSYINGNLEAKLRSMQPALRVINPSFPGAASWDMAGVIQQAQQSGSTMDFVIMEFGHNDYCSYQGNTASFKSAYLNNLRTILTQNPKARILIFSLLNIPNVYQVAPGSATAVKIPNTLDVASFSCQQIREEAEAPCPTALSRAPDFARWNTVPTEVARETQSAFPNARIALVTSLSSDAQFTKDKVAFDCFHPNRLGYETIAAEAWRTIETTQLFKK